MTLAVLPVAYGWVAGDGGVGAVMVAPLVLRHVHLAGFDDRNIARRSFRQFLATKLPPRTCPLVLPAVGAGLRPRDRSMMRETMIYGPVKS